MPLNIIIMVVIVIFDRLVKMWAVDTLKPVHEIPVIGDAVCFRYAENTGAAASSFSGNTVALAVVSVVFIAAAAFFLVRYYKKSALLRIGISFVIGGAVGNLIDRAMLSYVIDMIYFKIINFPIFNVADSFITIGAVLIVLYLLRGIKDDYRRSKNEKS